jgi:phytoene synthase
MLFLDGATAFCRSLAARSRSSFYYAFLFLPRAQREALEAVYAFCRLVDDVVDDDAPADVKRAGLEFWRRALDDIFHGGSPAHPVAVRLQHAARHFPIRREDLEAIIDGCAMDIDKTRYANFGELRSYCYRVASAVGLICIEIFGYSSPRARDYAIDLGIALQLTNILRDVAEDARRGRIYLPVDELAAFGVRERDLLDGKRTPELDRYLRVSAQRARAHYLRARAAVGKPELRRLVVAEIMGDIYYALLEKLEATGFDVFGKRASLGPRRKMAIAIGRFAQARLGDLLATA